MTDNAKAIIYAAVIIPEYCKGILFSKWFVQNFKKIKS